MKVAFVVYGDLDRRSGGFLYDDHLRRRLEHRGHQVRVVSQEQGSLLHRVRQNGRRLEERILAASPDLILADELNHPSLFQSMHRFTRTGAVTAAVVHHLRCLEDLPLFDRSVTRTMEKRFLSSVQAYIANSRHTDDSVRRLIGSSTVPSKVVTPGAGNPMGTPRASQGILRVLYVGNLIRRKGLDRLIAALMQVEDAPWELDIVGDDTVETAYAKRCKDSCADFIAAGTVRFHGRVDEDFLQDLRNQCDVLAVPSDMEGFGIVYLEAMRAAMVPVASRHGGAEELIRDGREGFLVSPDEPDRLEEVLRRLALDTDLRTAMAQAARHRSTEFPDWDRTMDEAVDFLEGLLE